MKYRQFGNTSLKVSEIGMGCWEIAGMSRGGGVGYGPQDDVESIRMIQRATELGINFFDTADAYGTGHSEVVLGRALKAIGGERPLVTTKVGNNFYVEPWKKDFAPDYVCNAAENSLQRLGIDCIDLYLLHGPSKEVIERGEVFAALDRLVTDGKIRYYGTSVQNPPEAQDAMDAAPNLAAVMCPYNILEQEATTLFETTRTRGIAVIARSPLATGRLAGGFSEDMTFDEGDYRSKFDRTWLQEAREKAEALDFLVKGDTQTLAQAALKFILASPDVTVAVPGPKTIAELEENVHTSESTPMGEDDLRQIADLLEQGKLKARPSKTP